MKLFKKHELANLWPFYSYYFIIALCGAVMPYMFIYFIDIGFTFLQSSLILGIFGLSTVVFEVPTGAFADVYSRKKSVVAGFVIAGAFSLLIYFTNNFYLLSLIMVGVGFGVTLTTGAEEAWVVSNLKKKKLNKLIEEFFIKAQFLMSISLVITSIAGVFVVKNYSIRPLWILWGAGFIVSGLVLEMFGRELAPPKKVELSTALRKNYSQILKGFKFILSKRIVFYIILGSAIYSMVYRTGDMIEPLMPVLGMPVYWIGYFAAGLGILNSVSVFMVKLIKDKVRFLIISLIVSSILFLITAVITNYIVAIILYLIFWAFNMVAWPIVKIIEQKNIEEKTRATVTSVNNMLSQLVGIFAGVLVGFVADLSTLGWGISIGAIFGIIGVYILLKLKRYSKSI